MEIDTESDFDLPSDNPTVQELTEQEMGLYWSALETCAEAVEAVTKYQEQHGEIDMDDPELTKYSENLRTATALSETLEELATWRRSDIKTDTSSGDHQSLGTEFASISSHLEDEEDE